MIRTYRLIWGILNRRERMAFAALMVMVLVMSIFEMIGVAAILPFLQVLAEPETVQDTAVLAWAWDRFGFTEHLDFAIALGLVVFGVVCFGLAFRAVTTWALIRFSLMRGYSISARLLAGYLHQPYDWFLSRNSAELGRAVLNEVDAVIRYSLLPGLIFLASCIVALCITALLFAVDPFIAVGAFVLLVGAYGLVYSLLRGILKRVGEERILADDARFRIAQEATGGIKDVKALRLEEAFVARFRVPAHASARAQTTGLVVGDLPRFVLEGVAFGGVILLILGLLITRGGSIETLLPTLGLVALAGVKLFPALQRAYAQISLLRFYSQSLENLHRDLAMLEPKTALPDPAPVPLRRALDLRGVVYAYPGAARTALRGLSLHVPAGASVGIVGGTGAGKTTVVDLILGLLAPQDGAVTVDEVALDDTSRRGWQRGIGYVPQSIFLSDDTVAGNIAFGVAPERIDRAAVERAARLARLHDFILSDLPQGYDTPVGERGVRLSGGQRQRIGIARALYHDPQLLVLDEATSALDTLTEAEVMESVGALGGEKTVIMIAHRLTTVRQCDIIFLLEDGRLVAQGRFEDLLRDSDRFRAMAQGIEAA